MYIPASTKAFLISLNLVCIGYMSVAQNLSFTKLNSANGLSSNCVLAAVIDQNGFLWAGTNSGLNVFDGYSVSVYQQEQMPELPSNSIIHLACNSKNEIWMGAMEGAAWLDKDRKCHRVAINDTLKTFMCRTIFETKTYGDVVFTNHGQYYFDQKTHKWQRIDWIPDFIQKEFFYDAEAFAEDEIIFIVGNDVLILNYKKQAITYRQKFDRPVSACKNGAHQIAVGLTVSRVQIVDIQTSAIVKDYQLFNEMNGNKISTDLSEVRKAANGSLVVASSRTGLVTIDSATGLVTRYTHNPIDPKTISSDNTFRAYTNPNGEVVVATQTSGLNICTIQNTPLSINTIFKDKHFNLFDNFLNDIVENKNEGFWIGSYDRLIHWNKKNNESHFYFAYKNQDKPIYKGNKNLEMSLEIRALCRDNQNRLWVGTIGDGLRIFDENKRLFTKIKLDTTNVPIAESRHILDIFSDSKGLLWVGTGIGIYTIDPKTLRCRDFTTHPILKSLTKKYVTAIYEDKKRRKWFGTYHDGLFCFDESKNELTHFNTRNGLQDNRVFDINEDDKGFMYCATNVGLNIIAPDGHIKSLSVKNGLHYIGCSSILKDQDGKMWLTNNKGLIKYDPNNDSITYFEENTGISSAGFSYTSRLKTQSGELLWGSNRGINYFYPRQLQDFNTQLNVSIYQVHLPDTLIKLTKDKRIDVAYSGNNVLFYYTAINLEGVKNVYYEYKLEGFDAHWQKDVNIRQARYALLPPGNYTFRLRASIDNSLWFESSNKVFLTVKTPFWKKKAVIFVAILSIISLIYAFYRYRMRENKKHYENKRKQQESLAELQSKAQLLEKEKAVMLYEGLKQQLNPHFLFNSLTSLSSLIEIDPSVASRFLDNMSKTYRYILKSSESETVPLHDEVRFAQNFVQLQQTRFGTGLEVHFDIDDADLDKKIVPVTIQNMIENAIKHNIIDDESPLKIMIYTEGGYLFVKNNLQKKNFVGTSNKRGLANLISLYKYFTDKPFSTEETIEVFYVQIPLL